MDNKTFLVCTAARYPSFPYGGDRDGVYGALRSLFILWGKDPDNPFGEWLKPGGRVVLKPNLVHYAGEGCSLEPLVTHASLIKHAMDFAAKAMDGKGTVVIGDAPLQSCDFERLLAASRLGETVELARKRYPDLKIIVEDWRLTVLQGGYTEWCHTGTQAVGDESDAALREKYELVDLGTGSLLEDIADYAEDFRVTCYRPSLMRRHHAPGRHRYLVTRSFADADLLVNLPKMKTHIKTGLTGALKNLVGINGHKEYLPHHILGAYLRGGDCSFTDNLFRRLHDKKYDEFWEHYDEYSPLRRRFASALLNALLVLSNRVGNDAINAGSWPGNETIWRTVIDLNHIVYDGLHAPRRTITLADGIIAGEGEGPLSPSPKPAGILLGGENPAYVDAVMAGLMGYNISRVPLVYNALYNRKSRFGGEPLEEYQVRCLFDGGRPEDRLFRDLPDLAFRKPVHWRRAQRRRR